jgi:flagellar biosynthetic protein FlhB
MAHDKTEKATPKKREDARKKGQVARSVDVNGAAVLLAGLLAMSAFGPKIMEQMRLAMTQVIALMATPQVVQEKGIGTLFLLVGQHVGLAALPICAVCFVAGLAAAAGQVGLKPTPDAIKPDFKKINPASGLKNLFNPQHLAVEGAKNIAKVVVVGAIAALALFPKLEELAALVGTPPQDLIPEIAGTVMTIAQRASVRSHCRRDRHQPDPLLRRAEVRQRQSRTHRRRQGRRQPRLQDP